MDSVANGRALNRASAKTNRQENTASNGLNSVFMKVSAGGCGAGYDISLGQPLGFHYGDFI